MPTSTRRQAHVQSRFQRGSYATVDVQSDELPPEPTDDDETIADQPVDNDDEPVGGDEEDDEEEDGHDEVDDPEPFPPAGLKEISSLASWTVSTAKPGNGVAALRSPDTSLFWQSDGPQPHLLSIHFFKLVSIVHIRIYLDFESDESYTPTKIQFLAGMSVHDIQEFAEMNFEQPTGWIDVDFSNVGPIEDDEDDDEHGRDEGDKGIDWSKRPVLRAFLVQVRILENHQNGKDTHLRAVQLFARDDVQSSLPTKATRVDTGPAMPVRGAAKQKHKRAEPNNLKKVPWMMTADLR